MILASNAGRVFTYQIRNVLLVLIAASVFHGPSDACNAVHPAIPPVQRHTAKSIQHSITKTIPAAATTVGIVGSMVILCLVTTSGIRLPQSP